MKYGAWWQSCQPSFYNQIFEEFRTLHNEFIDWVKSKDIKSILEVGCGTGHYGEIFADKRYFGNDISKSAIEEARKKDENPRHNYRSSDFIQDTSFTKWSFDLVFAHSVIDHVYDIDGFLEKCIKKTLRYVWITAYLRPHEGQHHIMNWQSDGYYFNNLSIPELEATLGKFNVRYTMDDFEYDKNKDKAFVILIERI